MWYHSLPIRWKISLSFFLATAVLLATVVLIVYQVSAALLVGKTVEGTRQNIRLIAASLDNALDTVISYTNTAITNRTVQRVLAGGGSSELGAYGDRVSVTGALDSVVGSGTLIESFVVLGLDGRVFDSGRIQSLFPPGIEGYGDFWDVRAPLRQRWEDTHKSDYRVKGENQDVVTYAKSFYDASTGRALGVILANVNQRRLAELYSRVPLGDTGRILFLNRDGVVMSSQNAGELYADMSGDPFFSLLADESGGQTFWQDGREFLVVYQYYERLDWVAVGLVPTGELTQESGTLIRRVLFALLGGVLLLSAIVLLVSRSLTKPLISLSRAIEDVSGGDLEAQADIFCRDEIGALAAAFNRMARSIARLMDNLVSEQAKKRRYELSLLQSQLNPHFLYNTLENVCGLAELGRGADVVLLASELAAFYRGVLSGGSMTICLREEIEITRQYVNVLRYSRKEFVCETDVDEDILPYSTIKLLLQPLVENAIQHGLPYKEGVGRVAIRGRAEGERIVLTVEDNGIGIPPERMGTIFEQTSCCYRSKAFGLRVTDERIKLYFGQEYGLRLTSVYGEGVTVTVTLPKLWPDETPE
jgi:two-component system sensor histidine kinase YesM